VTVADRLFKLRLRFCYCLGGFRKQGDPRQNTSRAGTKWEAKLLLNQNKLNSLKIHEKMRNVNLSIMLSPFLTFSQTFARWPVDERGKIEFGTCLLIIT
jgi:hypothetical protein